jgi:hypothetical protein
MQGGARSARCKLGSVPVPRPRPRARVRGAAADRASRRALVGAALALFAGLTVTSPAAMATAPVAEVPVTVVPDPRGPVIEPSFLGLSIEASAVPQIARDASQGNLTALLRSLGPGVLRIGGASVDQNTAFVASGLPPPWAATTIVPHDFDGLRRLARRSGWSIILTVTLGHYDPEAAAREVAEATRRLGSHLIAVEIGNEPNAYSSPLSGLRPASWGFGEYRAEVRRYRRAIAAVAPHLALAGPDAADRSWVEDFAGRERPALLTAHHYPLDVCSAPAPAIADLLAPATGRSEARALRAFVRSGTRHGIAVRLDETNNIGCSGRQGVSNTYASALWAIRYLDTAAHAGLVGVNLHTLPDNCRGYAPICADPLEYAQGQLRAMPEWYAMLLFRELVGDRAARLKAPRAPDTLTLGAYQRLSGRGADIVAVNVAPTAARLTIASPGRPRSAATLRLTGGPLDATAEVRLGGAPVSSAGGWRAAEPRERLRVRAGRVTVLVPGGSAALIRIAARSK